MEKDSTPTLKYPQLKERISSLGKLAEEYKKKGNYGMAKSLLVSAIDLALANRHSLPPHEKMKREQIAKLLIPKGIFKILK